MPNYGDLIYWENRYSEHKESTFEWLEDFDSLKEILEEISKGENFNSGNILMLGCGNSELSEKIYQEMDIKNIFNIDLSSNLIRFMKERNLNKPEMSWEVMDARDLKYPPNFFDIVIDQILIKVTEF